MRVLVTGAAGFLGRQLVDELCRRGHAVRAIVRPASTACDWPEGVEVFKADLQSSEGLPQAFDGVDAAIHLAAAMTGSEDEQLAATVLGTERFLDAMRQSSVRRLVHVSSLVVYDWSRANGYLDEDTPLLAEADLPLMGAYTLAKARQEMIVSRCARNYGWDLTIVRPGFVWGAQRPSVAAMGRLIGPFHVMIGPASRVPLSHVVNCANALTVVLESPNAIGQTFNLIDGDRIRVWRYAWEYARGMRQFKIPIPVPYYLAIGAARVAERLATRLGAAQLIPSGLRPRRIESQFKPLRYSTQRLEHTLKWVPPLRFEECVKLTFGLR